MSTIATVACYGEILWDMLPNGKNLGGAPLNVCYHLGQLEINAAMISRIGNDAAGREIRQLVTSKRMTDEFLQVDPKLPTSEVLAVPGPNNEMQYTIVENVAWDRITLTPSNQSLAKQAGYFVFGSLCSRSATSRETLNALLALSHCSVFDVNLRKPFYDAESIATLLQQTDILKLNETELAIISDWFLSASTTEDRLTALAKYFRIDEILVTCGPNGAMAWVDGRTWTHPGFRVTVADTVGSGDAFLAAYLSARIRDFSMEKRLDMANRLAALVTGFSGACPEYDPHSFQTTDTSMMR